MSVTASPTVSSTIGLKNVVLAPLTEDTETTLTYGNLMALAGAIDASITPSNTDADVQYADDDEFDVLYPDPELSFKTIPSGTFQFCSSLSKFKIPRGVTSIGSSAFMCCKSLSTVTLPSGIKEICSRAFNKCCTLENINFPLSLEKISSEAFKGCDKLHDIVLSNPIYVSCEQKMA